MTINVYTKDSDVFLNLEEIQRISFSKSDTLKQSERLVKVVFTDGQKGEYIAHRDLQSAMKEYSLKKENPVEHSCNCQ